MRINLMDGSLRALGGHPHDFDLRIARALVEAGHDVHVYCHIQANDTLKSHYQPLIPVTPLFTVNCYAPPQSFDVAAGDIMKNLDGGRITANELRNTRDADVWLWPSLYSHQLLACSMSRTRALVAGCIHHSPDFFSPGDTAWWRYGFLQSRLTNIQLKIGAIEPETRYLYAPLTTDGYFPLLPFPNDGIDTVRQRQALKTIGVFGYQRTEKGGVFMRTLLGKLVADGYRVILHDSNPASSDHRDIPGVTYVGHVMDLNDEITKCDLVLTPYHPESYRHRGSGIVMNAVSCGVPVVTPFGSAPGRFIEQTGAGTLFTHYTADSVYAAVQAAARDYPVIATAAYSAGSQWKQQHGVKRFIDAILPTPLS